MVARSYKEHIGLMADGDAAERDTKKAASRLNFAGVHQSACIKDDDSRTPRGLDSSLLVRLMIGEWSFDYNDLAITGATGICKSGIGCKLGQKASGDGRSVPCQRRPRSFEALGLARRDGGTPG